MRGRTPRRSRMVRIAIASFAFATVAATAGLASTTPAVAAPTIHTYDIAPGITLTTINYSSPLNEVRILTITQGADATIDLGQAAGNFGSYEPTSGQAHDNGAVAAVNGDFSLDARPVHWNEIDGELRTSGIQTGVAFSVTQDKVRAWARHPDFSISASSVHGTFAIDHWNGGQAGAGGAISAFTATGGNVEQPGNDMCAARLSPSGTYTWSNADKAGVERTYDVAAQRCRFSPMSVGSTAGNVVLNASRACTCKSRIRHLATGDSVTLTWKTVGWKGTLDEIGGQPMLVQDHVNVGPPSTAGTSYFYKNNPRTGVGVSDGCVDTDPLTKCVEYLVTVDGRQSTWSTGMNLHVFANEFMNLNVAYAINLDGGGSTTMWVSNTNTAYCEDNIDGGCVVNRPSAGPQRAVPTTLQVLEGVDNGEPPNLSRVASTSPATFAGLSTDPSWNTAALTDPGSTGGLFDAIAESGGGGGKAFRSALDVYRASRTG